MSTTDTPPPSQDPNDIFFMSTLSTLDPRPHPSQVFESVSLATPLAIGKDGFSIYPDPVIFYPTFSNLSNLPPRPNPGQFQTECPPIFIGSQYIAEEVVLSDDLLGEINKLTDENFIDYSPWENVRLHPVHDLITRVLDETIAKFPKGATAEDSAQRLKLCEKAISQIELALFPMKNLYSNLIEIGFRHQMMKHLTSSEADALAEFVSNAGPIPEYIEHLPECLIGFGTRGGHYLQPDSSFSGDKLIDAVLWASFCKIKEQILKDLSNLSSEETLSDSCNELIQQTLTKYAPSSPCPIPIIAAYLEFHSRKAVTENYASLIQIYARGYKQAFDEGTLTLERVGLTISELNDLGGHLNPDFRATFIETMFGKNTNRDTQIKQIEEQAQAAKDSWQSQQSNWRQRIQRIFGQKQTSEKIEQEKAAAFAEIDKKKEAQRDVITYLYSIIAIVPEEAPNSLVPPVIEPPQEAQAPQGQEAGPLPQIQPEQPVAPAQHVIHYPPPPPALITSYIDLAFSDLLGRNLDGTALYEQFSTPVREDLIHNLFNLRLVNPILYPIEARVEEAFKKNVNGLDVPHINALYLRKFRELKKELRSMERTPEQLLGEEILDLYYQAERFTPIFAEKLARFPASERFLGYVRELAIAAQVKIPDNEQDWALTHYKELNFAHLTMQALERYLHTS